MFLFYKLAWGHLWWGKISFNKSSLGKIYGFSHLSSPSSSKSLCSSRQLSKPGWHKQDQLPRNMVVLLSESRSAQGGTWLKSSWGEKCGPRAQRDSRPCGFEFALKYYAECGRRPKLETSLLSRWSTSIFPVRLFSVTSSYYFKQHFFFSKMSVVPDSNQIPASLQKASVSAIAGQFSWLYLNYLSSCHADIWPSIWLSSQ